MGMAHFTVSDYLEGAPIKVIEGIARTIMARIRGEERTDYSDETVEWLTSPEFRELNQERYIERSRSIGDMDFDGCERIWDSYYRLVDSGWCLRSTA